VIFNQKHLEILRKLTVSVNMTHRVFNDDCLQVCQCRVLEMPPERKSRRHKFPKGKRDCEAELASGSQQASRSVIVKYKSQKIPPPSQLRCSQSPESRVPEVFRSMLGALSVSPTESGSRRKRRKTHVETEVTPHGNAEQYARGSSCATVVEDTGEPLNDGEDYETPGEFEGITGTKQMQIESSGSDDDSEQSEFEWEEVDIKTTIYKADEDKSHLELTLNRDRSDAHRVLKARRRKTITKADRILRLEVHKMHLLCLLAFFYRRNWWCNDEEIQRTLEPLITKKISACFNPPATYSSFGKAESIKKGLALCVEMWSSKFQVTEKGMRRSFWVEEVQLNNVRF
jgi:xeroderma pigmentosum group C-complementing protein